MTSPNSMTRDRGRLAGCRGLSLLSCSPSGCVCGRLSVEKTRVMDGDPQEEGWYWVPDQEEMFVAGREVSRNAKGQLVCVAQDGHTLHPAPAEMCFSIVGGASALDEAPPMDLVKLSEVNPPSILHALRTRFMKKQIYTVSGRGISLPPEAPRWRVVRRHEPPTGVDSPPPSI